MAQKNGETNPAPAKDVDSYIAAAPEEARPMLAEMRRILKAAAPQATELISYGIPSYKQRKMLVAFGAARKHCGLYAMSAAVMEAHKEELEHFGTSKGTVRFPFGEKLPERLIRKLVQARIAENEAK